MRLCLIGIQSGTSWPELDAFSLLPFHVTSTFGVLTVSGKWGKYNECSWCNDSTNYSFSDLHAFCSLNFGVSYLTIPWNLPLFCSVTNLLGFAVWQHKMIVEGPWFWYLEKNLVSEFFMNIISKCSPTCQDTYSEFISIWLMVRQGAILQGFFPGKHLSFVHSVR